jgi:branched-chain amino acid transport system substrate-binding protein
VGNTGKLVIAVLATLTVACANGSGGAGLTGGGRNSDPGRGQIYKIGVQGVFSGDNKQGGLNEVNGAELAVHQANESGKLPFKFQLERVDDGGEPGTALAAAFVLLQDSAVVGVVGPMFSGPTKAVGSAYSSSVMPVISPSATSGELTSLGFSTFHRIVPPDSVEGVKAADFLAKKAKKVFVVDDTTEYGKGAADVVRQQLQRDGVAIVNQAVPAHTIDYGAVAQAALSSHADAVYFGGYDVAAAMFAKALKAAGFAGLRMSGNGAMTSTFARDSGQAGDGWYLSCGCLDATVAPQARDFTKAYTTAFNTAPGVYSAESYDATNAMIEAIKAAASKDGVTRETVEDAVDHLDYKGLTTTIKFEPNGEVRRQVINLYEQKNGAIGLIGEISSN